MKFSLRFFLKAIAVLLVAMAFFLSGCQTKKVLDIFPKRVTPPDTFLQAESDFNAGDYGSALKGYLGYLQEHPKGENARPALYRIVRIYHLQGRYRESIPLLRQILSEYPDHPETPLMAFNLAEIFFRLGDYKQAELEAVEWTRRFTDDPLRGEAYLLLVKSLSAQGNWVQAFYWALESSEMFDDDPLKYDVIKKWIQSLIEKVDIGVLKEMLEYAGGGPFAPPILHRLALIHLQENQIEDAKTAAMSLIQSTSEDYYVQEGRRILDKIEQESSVQVGVIGCLLPLSGPFAIYGQEVLNGIQLGLGMFEEEGRGKNIELIIRDTEGDPERASQMVETLALREKVLAIIGPLASKPAMASAEKAQDLGVPIITLTQKEGITDIGDMVFRHFLIPDKEVHKILDNAMNEMGFNRFGILYPDNSYGRFLMNLFWDQVEERGGKIAAVEPYQPEQTDFAPEIKRMVGLYYPRPESIKKMLLEMKALENEDKTDETPVSKIEAEPIVDFDAVFIPDSYHQVALIAPQFPFHNVFNVQFLGTSLWQSPKLIETSGEYVQNAIFPSGFYHSSESEEVVHFVNLYLENFEEEPGVLAATGYDTMRFLKKMLTTNPVKTRKEFMEALLTFNDFTGVTGNIAFDRRGEVTKDPILLKVSGNTFRMIR